MAHAFKDSVYKFVKTHGGIITILNAFPFIKILIAMPVAQKNSFNNLIKEKIAETILIHFKKDYILSRLDFNFEPTPNMQIFLKALVVFDSDTDKAIITKRLDFENNLVVNSFIHFKLSFLKRKWDELVSLANDNVLYLLSQDSFSELIKFLISNLEYRYYAVNIFSKQDCYLLCDTKGEAIKDFLIEKSVLHDDSALLVNLVALNPEKIIIHNSVFLKDKLLKTLYEFFSNRVEISK